MHWLVKLVAVLALAISATTASSQGMGIEELMREIQVRRAYFNGALFDWPHRQL